MGPNKTAPPITLMESLHQAALAETKSAELVTSVAQLRERCAAEHADKAKTLVECDSCLEQLLSSIRARYLENAAPEKQRQAEWFSSRESFLEELDSLFTEALQRRLDPRDIDARVKEERSRWYLETVRSSLVRLIAEDRAGKDAVLNKLQDDADPTSVAAEASQMIKESPFLSREPIDTASVSQRLLAATESDLRIEILKETFLSTGDTIPDEHQKYLEMLRNGQSMDQVIEHVLDKRQAAAASREQEDKLKEKLNELRRARAGYEQQKSRRERKRARLAEQVDVPDELYDLPPCFSCGKSPDTGDFLCCPVCAILVRYNLPDAKPTVFCSDHDHPSQQNHHFESHTCASGDSCISSTSTTTPTPSDPTHSLSFCRECLTALKIPSAFCSPACADTNFQRHREEVHMPARKRLEIIVTDRETLEYFPTEDGSTRYRAKDISAHVIPLEEAVRRWEGENHVKLQMI